MFFGEDFVDTSRKSDLYIIISAQQPRHYSLESRDRPRRRLLFWGANAPVERADEGYLSVMFVSCLGRYFLVRTLISSSRERLNTCSRCGGGRQLLRWMW